MPVRVKYPPRSKIKQVRHKCDCHSAAFDKWYGEKVRLFNSLNGGPFLCVVCDKEFDGMGLGK